MERPTERLGRYTLIRKIGNGGMAEVWKARSQGAAGFEKLVAVKRILPHLAADDEFVEIPVDDCIEAKIDRCARQCRESTTGFARGPGLDRCNESEFKETCGRNFESGTRACTDDREICGAECERDTK